MSHMLILMATFVVAAKKHPILSCCFKMSSMVTVEFTVDMNCTGVNQPVMSLKGLCCPGCFARHSQHCG